MRLKVTSKVLGDDPRLPHRGHETGIACPARHNVDVGVLGDASPGSCTHVDADIEALRLVDFAQTQ